MPYIPVYSQVSDRVNPPVPVQSVKYGFSSVTSGKHQNMRLMQHAILYLNYESTIMINFAQAINYVKTKG